ncbi:MAG TPA: hypothetical protein VH092_33410 [Urbifossiella sp.]|nr:hypothetical protein [Urbifossiella sp.]
MFTRLLSPQNFEPLTAPGVPISLRLMEGVHFYDAGNKVAKLYLFAVAAGGVRARDAVEAHGWQLRAGVVICDLADEFLPTIPKSDPTYAVRIRGLEQMKDGLAGLVTTALQLVADRLGMDRDDLASLVAHMRDTFPRIVPRLRPGTKAEVVSQLRKLNDDPANQDLQPGLGQLRTAVAAAQ